MIKDLCILLKALTEWNLPLTNHQNRLKEIFKNLLKVTDWIDADSVLKNCFLNVLQVISLMEIGRSCVMEEVEGKPLIKGILQKTQAMSTKPPHTDVNLKLIKTGISVLQTCSRFVDVRMMLKNMKIFQMLEVLHPQIHKTRKSTWDDVTITWMKFFEFLSRSADTECIPKWENIKITQTFWLIFKLFSVTFHCFAESFDWQTRKSSESRWLSSETFR